MILIDENDVNLSADNRVACFPSRHNIVNVQIQIELNSFHNKTLIGRRLIVRTLTLN